MPTGGNWNHLFVVCTSPCAANKVVLANISSWKATNCDPTVRLSAGVHPFITRDSYVVYNFSDIERCITIQAGIDQGRFTKREPFPELELTEICDGMTVSRFTPRKVKRYLLELHA